MLLRENFEEEISPALWTEEEARHHLATTFDHVCRGWPGMMQPYEVMLADAPDDAASMEIMRTGLRETISLRFPFTHQI